MSGYQGKIEEFPEDESLWLVKWIDEFRQPHVRTRSTSVGVVLQQLAARDFTELSSLRANQLSQIIGKRRNDDMPSLKNPRVMVGSLPLLEIGQIYQSKKKVSQLPTEIHTLAFKDNNDIEISLGDLVPPPPGWKPEIPYKTINTWEYYGLYRLDKCRCQVVRVPRDEYINEYIIPRTTLHKAFYAQHTEIAKAFSKGPWSKRYTDVICMFDFESGLKTQCSPDGRKWDIVMETLVPNTFAPLLALLHFDEYAKKCAESIYASSMQDTGGRADVPWYASAKIPYRPVNEAFLMRVKCLPLPRWTVKSPDKSIKEIRKYLVTSVVGSSWPSHLPIVGVGRRNSGTKGVNQIPVDGPAPYMIRPGDEENGSNPETTVDASLDASQDTDIKHLAGDDWNWINEPVVVKLTKESSKMYEGDRPVRQSKPGDRTSTGEHTHQQDGLVKGQAAALVRAPEKRFEHIIKALEQLREKKHIEDIHIVPAKNSWQHTTRGGRNCWSFIDEETAKRGKRPRRSWRLVEYASETTKQSIPRCALVLEIAIGGKSHYWIEIECRKTDQGFRSALLSNLGADYCETLEIAIETIVLATGINLEKELKKALATRNVLVDSYKHHYGSKERADLDINSVLRFLSGR